jgi:hypothetical protein
MRLSRYIVSSILMLFLAVIIGISCEDTSGIEKETSPWLKLEAELQDGIAPDTVTFTGTLKGDVDTLLICYPKEYSYCIDWPPKGCIWFAICDTLQKARRTYIWDFVFEEPGRHRAIMRLYCRNYPIDDDTTATSYNTSIRAAPRVRGLGFATPARGSALRY